MNQGTHERLQLREFPELQYSYIAMYVCSYSYMPHTYG